MLGDLVGKGEEGWGAHIVKPGRFLARRQMEPRLPF
jgi:hypothetical protein